ncbi:hypothetical protein ABVT39_017570 [Epinephelus coioides]
MQLLNEKLSYVITHKLGTFLCPRFKSLKMFPAEERNAVHDQARRLVREFDRALTPPPAGEPEATVRVEEPERAKRKRDEFSEWEDDGEEDGEKGEI